MYIKLIPQNWCEFDEKPTVNIITKEVFSLVALRD